MSDLRGQLIRLAHAKPELRAQLLSVITDKTAMEFPTQEALKKYLKEHPGADKSLHHVQKSAPQPKGKPEEKEKAPQPKVPGDLSKRLQGLGQRPSGEAVLKVLHDHAGEQLDKVKKGIPPEKFKTFRGTSDTWMDFLKAQHDLKEMVAQGQDYREPLARFQSSMAGALKELKALGKVPEKVKLPKASTGAHAAYENKHPELKAVYKAAPTKVFGKNEGYSAPAIMKLVKQLHEKVNPIEASKLLDESEKTYHEALSHQSKGEGELLAAYTKGNPRPDHDTDYDAWYKWRGTFDKTPEMKEQWDNLAKAQNTWRAVRTWQEETKENLADVKAFKKTKPLHGGVKLSDAQLMQKFLQHAKPETKERMKGMSPHEFVQLLGAIMDDETGEAGKTAGGTPEWAKGKKFMHPKTRNKVNFSSLPPEEQAKLRAKQKGKKKTLNPPKPVAFGESPEDKAELQAFKKSKPARGRVKLTDAQLMQKFLQKAKPETKKRMKGVSPAEFVKMLGAIMDDEGGEGGKTASTNLRGQIIRLAHARPDLRADLLAVLQEPKKVAVNVKMAGKFPLGQTVMTSAVAAESRSNPAFAGFVARSLRRHGNGDWGEGDAGDRRLNDAALKSGDDRLFSVYKTPDNTIWIITEWDRSVTTILFPSDY